MKWLAMIACVSSDGGLGMAGDLLWHIPEDMQFFRKTTTGHPVVMGGNTFRSIGKPLPNRENIVLSRSELNNAGVVRFDNIEELTAYLEELDATKFIIGGASLYSKFLDLAETLYLTEVDAVRPADTFFPEFDHADFTKKVIKSDEFEGIKYQIVEYKRK